MGLLTKRTAAEGSVDHPPPFSAEVKNEYFIPVLPFCASCGMLWSELYLSRCLKGVHINSFSDILYPV